MARPAKYSEEQLMKITQDFLNDGPLGRPTHEWEATVNSRVAGNGCPYCAGQKIIVGVNDLATKRPELITQWHPIKMVHYDQKM